MKRNQIIIISVITLLITLSIIYFISRDNKKIDLSMYEITDANKSCYYKSENLDEDSYINDIYNFMYLYENNNKVSKVIYKTVYESTYFDTSLSMFISNLMDLYNGVEGISTSLEKVNKKTIVTITYDYETIDIEKAKEQLKNILDEESVIMNMKKNITIDEYIKLETSEYICE